MIIAVIGASGVVGQRIVREALAAGHLTTAIARHAEGLGPLFKDLVGVTIAVADVWSRDQLAGIVRGHDAIVCAMGPCSGGNQPDLARCLLDVARRAQVHRLVKVGWEQDLVISGARLVTAPALPTDVWSSIAKRRHEVRIAFSARDLDCTYVTPAAFLDAGIRTGIYRRGSGELLIDATGKSRVSVDDFALAVVDEVEKRNPSGHDLILLGERRYGLIS